MTLVMLHSHLRALPGGKRWPGEDQGQDQDRDQGQDQDQDLHQDQYQGQGQLRAGFRSRAGNCSSTAALVACRSPCFQDPTRAALSLSVTHAHTDAPFPSLGADQGAVGMSLRSL